MYTQIVKFQTDLLALVCAVFCEFVTFPLVSWVRCGTWLYRFLIFATLLTFICKIMRNIIFLSLYNVLVSEAELHYEVNKITSNYSFSSQT